MKKILVIGIKGMAGHLIFKKLPQLGNYNIFGVARNINQTEKIFNIDVNDTSKLSEIIIKNSFDIIINCIGILNKDAEDNPDNAIWYNSYFPHFLEKTTKNSKTKIIHISTDCVFSGKKGNYSELDHKDGKGFYAQSKSIGEIINEKDLTIRTSIIGPEINKNGIGLFNWFMSQNNLETLKGFSKAYWSGITTLELAKTIDWAIKNEVTGLKQISRKKISKYNLLQLCNKFFKNNEINIVKDKKYKVDKSLTSIRIDYVYEVPTYKKMIIELKEWILSNNYHYQIK